MRKALMFGALLGCAYFVSGEPASAAIAPGALSASPAEAVGQPLVEPAYYYYYRGHRYRHRHWVYRHGWRHRGYYRYY